MVEKFSLKQNPFVIFMYNYAPVFLSGAFVIFCIGDFIPVALNRTVMALLFLYSLYRGIVSLLKNNRYLVISDDSISLGKFKKRNFIVLEQYKEEQIELIDAADIYSKGIYKIIKNDGTNSFLQVSGIIKPEKALLLKINAALLKNFGKKISINDKYEIEEYIETGDVPKQILSNDENIKAEQFIFAFVFTLLSVYPTFYAILTVALGILFILKFFVAIIIKILEIIIENLPSESA